MMKRCFRFVLLTFAISIIIFLFNIHAWAYSTSGIIVEHEASEEIPYHWFSYIPDGYTTSQKIYILITCINGLWNPDHLSCDYEYQIQETKKYLGFSTYLADDYGYVIVTPVIPRGFSQLDGKHKYPAALAVEALQPATEELYRRPDLKLNKMIVTMKGLLKQDGYTVNEKIFLMGFSAGGMWSQRYTLLYPQNVQAIACGQAGGSITLPKTVYEGTPMNWPVGINDFQSLVGYGFNMSSYQQVPQFIYIGDQDTNNSTVAVGNHDLFTDSQMGFLNENFGDSDPVRVQNQCAYMTEMGCNITFKLYPGVGHQKTSDMIADTFTFFKNYRDNDDGDDSPPPADRFIDNGDDTVYDTLSNLTWQTSSIGYDVNWYNSKTHCESKGNDWRLPTFNELTTIYSTNGYGAYDHVATPLINIEATFYWSSDTKDSEAAVIAFDTGNMIWWPKNKVYYSRCLPVRSGK